MFLWLYDGDTVVQQRASFILMFLLKASFPDFESRSYSQFFQEIVDHGIPSRDVYSAILLDLVGEEDFSTSLHRDRYGTLVTYASKLRLEDDIPLNSHIEHALLWYSLSAGRKELCSMERNVEYTKTQKYAHDNECIVELCAYLW